MTVRRDVELLGDDCLLWASDFPHEATRTDMKELVKEFFDRRDLTRDAKKKIAFANPRRFYAL
jgi:predicted TIM-barrel fold metal-dependent hydrolase